MVDQPVDEKIKELNQDRFYGETPDQLNRIGWQLEKIARALEKTSATLEKMLRKL